MANSIVRLPFLNGSSEDMNVDGSVTPVVFTVNVSSIRAFLVTDIHLYIEDPGKLTSYTEFMSQPALGSGFSVDFSGINSNFISPLMKNNRDLIKNFLLNNKFVDGDIENNVISFSGSLPLDKPAMILGGNDTLQSTIADDLTFLRKMTMFVEGVATS